MNYRESINYINSIAIFGTKPGLTRIKVLLKALGNPQKKLKCIHVAGTNGKGSTCAMLDAVLRKQGYRVGLCTSPYLYDFCERIRINGENISRDELAQHMTHVKSVIETLEKNGQEPPTAFEIVVAVTLLAFAENELDFCVIEVGMGGRWDATNIIEPPLVAAVTAIAFDHMEYLGDTLPKIAYEKAGVFKSGSRAVAMGGQAEDVLDVILEQSLAKQVPVTFTEPQELQIIKAIPEYTEFTYYGKLYKLSLAGVHQVQNAAVALECLAQLRKCGVTIDEQSIIDGLKNVEWRGRQEVLCREPLVLADVAHNPDGMRALVNSLNTMYADRKIYAVVSMCRDKQVDICVGLLAPLCKTFYTAQACVERAMTAEELAALAFKHCRDTKVCESVTIAVKMALSATIGCDNALVLICGSHYMMGEAYAATNTIV